MVVLTEQEAADYLRQPIKTFRRWRWLGKGPRCIKMNGLRSKPVYDQADLDAFIESRRGPVQAYMENRNGFVQKIR